MCGISWLGAQVLKLVLAAPFGHAEEEYSVLHAGFFLTMFEHDCDAVPQYEVNRADGARASPLAVAF